MKIAILSNVNVDTIIKKISKKYDIYKTQGYGEWVQELVIEKSFLHQFSPENIFLILDGEELFRGFKSLDDCNKEIEQYFSYIEMAVKKFFTITFFVSNIDLYSKKLLSAKEVAFNRELEFFWYKKISDLNEKYNNFIMFDLKSVIEDTGRQVFYSAKMWYLAGIKYSLKGQNLIQEQVERLLKKNSKRKKCLVLDLDNTLWGGIVGESGINGISLSEFKEGARYKDFQKRIKDIKDTGIILAIVSKNNVNDAMEVIDNHPHMVLRKNDFVAIKINWKNKIENIKEIAQELNIGTDSMVFIDDNPIERESVKNYIQGITVPDFPEDTSELEYFATRVYYDNFFTLRVLNEDKEKTQMYKENIEREHEKTNFASIDDFYKNLNMKIFIKKVDAGDIPRASQLTQKTNQFNVTTKRYTESEIQNFVNSRNYDVYIASVQDKFGDNGKCILLIINKTEKFKAKIDTFLLSCRVMGRNIEYNIQKFIEDKLLKEGYNEIEAEYIPNEKNKPVENLFEELGYSLIAINNGTKNYVYSIDKGNIKNYNVFAELIER
ncbi:HAD-IIIC family phosphatase [Clostridium scatologenes]|uniref:FkbH like protein n=1 Tax=Clostridium scatologenes TaxID=1548 RepID=A0A0E3MA48_CLOSL|nr:HAD-IIIC family phosphatase [Clostridium scatologenes]AKA70303.1 FkbH like protein [Clostridium scatologenes]